MPVGNPIRSVMCILELVDEALMMRATNVLTYGEAILEKPQSRAEAQKAENWALLN